MTNWTTTILFLTWVITAVYLGNGFGGISLKFLRARRNPYMLTMSMALFGIALFEFFIALLLLVSVLRMPARPPNAAEVDTFVQYIQIGFALCLVFRAALCTPFFLQANDVIGDGLIQRWIARVTGEKRPEA